jgi:hypothetical protein
MPDFKPDGQTHAEKRQAIEEEYFREIAEEECGHFFT